MKTTNLQTDSEKLQFLLAELQATATRECCLDFEYYSPCDNGNYDDAFEDGDLCGQVSYARYLLDLLTK